ncbi:MAG TPA: hypothetical protein VHB77_09385, partial [Planctomycetaceae bacterium]|nr:hypothetical protein [Planctomycetaceae bacterium]
MKALVRIAIGSVCAWWIAGAPAVAAELVFPANRQAYFCSEPIELAAAGIEANHVVAAELDPDREGLPTVKLTFKGPGTRTLVLPPYSLAPARYAVKLEGKDVAQLTITPGVNSSTMLVSQTADASKLRAGGANFILGNAFSFGQLTPDGKPARELRQRRSGGLEQFERGVSMDLSTICYMYWTGYVVHKPWGSEKSWADETMVETMRLFNLHTAQRLRRYSRSIISVGALDEPGLAWGKTPAGGMASGFPNWDEDDWYST